MKTKTSLVIAFLLLLKIASAQDLFYKTYNWERQFARPETTEKEKTILYETDVVEFAFDSEEVLYEYYFNHLVEFVNSESEVEKNFKKYISHSSGSELIDAQAKVIKPTGDEIYLDKSKILTSKNEETGETLKYFALEGLTKGDIVNFFFVIKKAPNYYGTYKTFQRKYPIAKYDFKLFAPEHLWFDLKVLNQDTEVRADTTYTGKNAWVLTVDSIPELIDQDGAPYQLLRAKVLYKLDKNGATGEHDFTNFGEASQNIYSNTYLSLDKKDLKAIKKIRSKIEIKNTDSEIEKILTVEDYVKSNFHFDEHVGDKRTKPSVVLKTKVTNQRGLTILFANIFKQMGIEHEIVLTSNRSNVLFDKDFESYHFLSEYLIYFPNIDKFLIPSYVGFRCGLLPFNFTDNNGLFISEIRYGDFVTGMGEVRYIPMAPYTANHLNHDVVATINDDFESVSIELTKSMSGHFSTHLQPYMYALSDDIIEEMKKEHIKYYTANLEITEAEFFNTETKYASLKPLVFKGKAINRNFIEVAGNSYLFKVGELIEGQVELYDKEERKLPVYDGYKREFNRKLKVIIPEGYTIKNPDDLKIKADYVKNGETVLLFDSNYNIEGNVLTVDIVEYYDEVSFEVSEYKKYRKVVNSASDFNKVVLVLEK